MYQKLLIGLLFLGLAFAARARDDKKPVAENDYASAFVLETIEIKLLANDFAYEDHPFEVFIVYNCSYGTFVKTDSSIIYTPDFYTPSNDCIDTLLYNIIDLENNLVSDFAMIIIGITNEGFQKLDINGVSCRINAYGLQFWSLDPNSIINYEVPAGSGTGTIFSQSLWIGGLDGSGQLHMAAERYRQVGADFFSGPVMDSIAYSQQEDVKWHKVWKLSSADVNYHQQHWQDEGYVPVPGIAEWPGNGDVALGQAGQLADYYDRDGDGFYDPLKGDTPLIRGDQAVLVIHNDDRADHTESGGRRLGVEVQTLYYAFEAPDDPALGYTTFACQHIINRSDKAYHDVYIGHFVDYDLGYFFDDYLHGDTLLESAICYNGLPADGQGLPGQYGEHPPAQSFTCLNYNMDGFVYFMSWMAPPAMQDPFSDQEYYNYLRGLWNDSTSFTYGGNGYGGEIPVRHVFTGDPVTGTGWTEENSPLGPGDRRGLISSGPYVLNPGDTIHLDFAFIFARDPDGNNISSLASLEDRIEQVRNFYERYMGIDGPANKRYSARVYPNPCSTRLIVETASPGSACQARYCIYNSMGMQVKSGELNNSGKTAIGTVDLPTGVYFLKTITSSGTHAEKIVKK